MATALLIATSQRTAAWQPARQIHHQNGEACKGSLGDKWSVRLCMCVVFFGGWREAGSKEKGKLARENKVNEAWRRLPSAVFGRGSRASSFAVIPQLRGGRGENGSLEVDAWLCLWKNSEAVQRSRACLPSPVVVVDWGNTWQHRTPRQSSARMFEQTLTCRMHLHLPQPQWISLDWNRPLGWGVKRPCWTHTTISRFEAITITMNCFVHWLITAGEEGNSPN